MIILAPFNLSHNLFVNKKSTFNCSINGAGTTSFLRCWDEEKQQILYPLSSSKTSLLRTSDSIFEEKNCLTTIKIKLIRKDVGRRTKNNECCAHCLRSKVCFWVLRASFLRKKLIDIKHEWSLDEWRTNIVNIVLTVFEQKFAFKTFGLHFWEKIDWRQTLMFKLIGRDVEWRTKTANTVPTFF